MAAAAGDGAVKPLQCAMKLANGAIELDTGNRPRVRRHKARRGRRPQAPPERPPARGGSGAGVGAPSGTSPAAPGARGAGVGVTLDSSPRSAGRSLSAKRGPGTRARL